MKVPEHANTKFQRFLNSLDEMQMMHFARSIGSSFTSVACNFKRPVLKPHDDHYTFNRPCKAQPPSKRMTLIAKATDGMCNYEDILTHFYRV